ncbi:hypothetical protein D3C80_1786270 [compost metagenome]
MLPPAGHAPKHQPGVAGPAIIRPQPQALHHTRTHPFDQDVCVLDQAQYQLTAFDALEVCGDRTFAAIDQVRAACALVGTFDGDHIGAEVSQVHGTKWPRANTANLNDLDTRQHGTHSFFVLALA